MCAKVTTVHFFVNKITYNGKMRCVDEAEGRFCKKMIKSSKLDNRNSQVNRIHTLSVAPVDIQTSGFGKKLKYISEFNMSHKIYPCARCKAGFVVRCKFTVVKTCGPRN